MPKTAPDGSASQLFTAPGEERRHIMPRTRYTRFIRRIELRRVTHQEKELVSIRQRLRCPETDVSAEPPVDREKEQRCIRYNRKHCY